jgi:hypothetical protein
MASVAASVRGPLPEGGGLRFTNRPRSPRQLATAGLRPRSYWPVATGPYQGRIRCAGRPECLPPFRGGE